MANTIIAPVLQVLVKKMNELGITKEQVIEGGPIREGNQWILIYFN